MSSDWVFEKMMKYIVKDDFKNAKNSALSDMNKFDNNSLSSMLILTAKKNIELIKIMAGFATMSENIKQYYTTPEKAINDYNK